MRDRHPQITEIDHGDFIGLANLLQSNKTGVRYAFYGKNVQFDGGKIISSPGHDPYLPVLAGTTNYQSIAKYQDLTGGLYTDYLATLHNKQWYLVDPASDTRTAVGSAVTTDEQTDAKQYFNALYFVAPTDGGGKIVGNTVTPIADIPHGSMIEFAWEKMWITGVVGAESTLYGSRSASAANPTYVEDFTTGAQTEFVGKGGRNTALRFLRDTLFIFKADSIHSVKPNYLDSTTTLYTPQPYSATGGAVNNRSTVLVENDIWFLTPQNEIRTLGEAANYSDPRTRDVSAIIKGLKDTLAHDQSAFAVAHYSNGIYKICLAEKGSSVANITITYNFINRGYGVDRFPSVRQWADIGDKVFMVKNGSGQLYRDRMGYTFGDDFAIPFEVRLPFNDLGAPDKNKRNRRIYLRGRRSKGVAMTVRLYQGDYDTYSDYVVPEPTVSEMGSSSISAPVGSKQYGAVPFGGSGTQSEEAPAVFTFEKHISTSKTGNMFAVGIIAELDGQRLEVDQVKLGILPGSRQPFNV